MITFRVEQTVGDVSAIKELDITYDESSSDAEVLANNRLIDVIYDLLSLEADLSASVTQEDSASPCSLCEVAKQLNQSQ